MNSYQSIIAKSRYSRYLPEEGRREDWPESAARWVDFFSNHLKDKVSQNDAIWDILGSAITNLESLPSMRSVMTAGEALERTHDSSQTNLALQVFECVTWLYDCRGQVAELIWPQNNLRARICSIVHIVRASTPF